MRIPFAPIPDVDERERNVPDEHTLPAYIKIVCEEPDFREKAILDEQARLGPAPMLRIGQGLDERLCNCWRSSSVRTGEPLRNRS